MIEFDSFLDEHRYLVILFSSFLTLLRPKRKVPRSSQYVWKSDQFFNRQSTLFLFQVKDERSKFRPETIPETDEIPDDRELNLQGFASQWDLQLFREAQV